MTVLLGGASAFLTGAPGAGKTYVLNEFIRQATRRGKTVAVTASTGIAATHLGGTTIHSWSGLGIREYLSDYDKQTLKGNARLKKRYNATDVLVIDEVSMLHGVRLDMINEVCKLLCESDEPFGGIQVVMSGDLFQLPPVSRDAEVVDFVHLSNAWRELDPKICYLSEQHRQAGGELLAVLEAMRSGQIEDYHAELVTSRLNQKPDGKQVVTRLYSHNIDVDSINQRHLSALKVNSKTYQMRTHGAKAKVEQLVKSVLAPEILTLKPGAEIMFVANDFGSGFANGTRGRVIDFDDRLPVVELNSGKKIRVEPHTWSLTEDGKKRAEVAQLPLRLAWAITIHKSQGMSLDAAEIDLGKTFTPGMGYVALSRVRSLDGLYLVGLNNMAMQLHPDIFEFDSYLRQLSASLASVTKEVNLAEISEESSEPGYDPELFEALREWRLDRARADEAAPFIIAHDKVLKILSQKKPENMRQLLATPGFGPKKVEAYGAEILEVISQFK